MATLQVAGGRLTTNPPTWLQVSGGRVGGAAVTARLQVARGRVTGSTDTSARLQVAGGRLTGVDRSGTRLQVSRGRLVGAVPVVNPADLGGMFLFIKGPPAQLVRPAVFLWDAVQQKLISLADVQ